MSSIYYATNGPSDKLTKTVLVGNVSWSQRAQKKARMNAGSEDGSVRVNGRNEKKKRKVNEVRK